MSEEGCEKCTDREPGREGESVPTEALVRAAFDSAVDSVIIADGSGVFVEANPAARAMLGLPGSGSISLPCHELFAHAGAGDPCFLRRVIVRGETIRDEEEHVVTAGGERRAVLVTASPLRFGRDEIAGAVFVLRDAAALEGLYEELRIEASTDELTGLSNRRELDRALAAELSRAERHSKPLAILMIDL
ncbi:MAG: PAS domain-containing protein, partial [Planctomycetota bacterium]